MGAGSSGPTYERVVKDLAEKHQMGVEAVDAIYTRFKMCSQTTDRISKEVFHNLFPFTTKLARDNMDQYCNVTDYCDLEGFLKLFKALSPQYQNRELANIIYETFKTEVGFDINTFITELKSNLFFTYENSQKELEKWISSKLQKGHKVKSLTKDQYDELTSDPNSYLLLYGRQLIFGSFIFQ